MKSFASDNFASVHPKILNALIRANVGHSPAYGADEWTLRATQKIQAEFKTSCEVYFVYGGTGANVSALQSCLKPYNSVICASGAHINVDECGAPERWLGAKLQDIPTLDGKLKVDQVSALLESQHGEHHVKPGALSITQSTEVGTLYSLQEMKNLGELCKSHSLYFHVDGARISNAAASLKTNLHELVVNTGVDILSLGGTKNGLMYGEAVVIFNKTLNENFKYIRKQSMQLASKMRFISAQFEALFTDQLWLENAMKANQMALRLEKGLSQFPQIKVLYPVQSNSVFVKIDKELRDELLKESFFWDWDTSQGIVRWMCSFDTEASDVDNFLNKIRDYYK
ncbi:MAG: low specificity L-threonine aldolase [Proteobacteria bacterium]|nr:low specificity L-threonine aldolase [Pseudomonadota bacterium]